MASVLDIPDQELLRRVIRHLKVRGGPRPLWTKVSRHFLLGSTFSKQLCERFGFDPEDVCTFNDADNQREEGK